MTEWKAAGYVFAVIAVIAISIALYLNRTKHLTLAYKDCRVDYAYKGEVDTTSDDYAYAECDFAKCLCNSYVAHPNKTAARIIVRIGSKYVNHIDRDSRRYVIYERLDSLLKYKDEVFDPHYGWED